MTYSSASSRVSSDIKAERQLRHKLGLNFGQTLIAVSSDIKAERQLRPLTGKETKSRVNYVSSDIKAERQLRLADPRATALKFVLYQATSKPKGN